MMAFFLSLFLILSTGATDFRDAYKGKINLEALNAPAEYEILLDSVNHYPLSKDDKDKILSNIVLSDAFFGKIPKKELFILIKMEIYKTVLSYFKPSDYRTARVNQKLIEELKRIENNHKQKLVPFARWVLKATIKDLSGVIKYKYYQTYLTQKAQNKKLVNIEFIKVDKKISLLTPWISLFMNSTPEEINITLRQLHFKLIERLAFLSKTIFYTSSFEAVPKLASLESLKFFKYSRELTSQESTLKKIDQVIGSIEIIPTKSNTDLDESNLPNPSNDWIPKDDVAPLRVKKSDLFPDPDPNYKKPDTLPEPVNDWLLEI